MADLAIVERNAHQILSNFEGDPYDGDAMSGGDALVDFSGEYHKNLADSFQNEVRAGKLYIMTITNPNQTREEFYISKGLNITDPASNYMQGQIAEGNFNSIAGNQMQAYGQPSPINRFLSFALFNPVHVVGLQISSTDPSNLAGTIELEPLSPLKKLGTKSIFLGAQRNEFAVKDTLLTVKCSFDINNQMEIKASIAPNSTVIYHLAIGAILNTAKALHVKRTRAKAKAMNQGRAIDGFSGEE